MGRALDVILYTNEDQKQKEVIETLKNAYDMKWYGDIVKERMGKSIGVTEVKEEDNLLIVDGILFRSTSGISTEVSWMEERDLDFKVHETAQGVFEDVPSLQKSENSGKQVVQKMLEEKESQFNKKLAHNLMTLTTGLLQISDQLENFAALSLLIEDMEEVSEAEQSLRNLYSQINDMLIKKLIPAQVKLGDEVGGLFQITEDIVDKVQKGQLEDALMQLMIFADAMGSPESN